MALPALRARLGLGLVRSYATGIGMTRVARGGSGGVNYGKTMNTADCSADGTRALVGYCGVLLNIVGSICLLNYFTQLKRTVDKIQSDVDLLVKDHSSRSSPGL